MHRRILLAVIASLVWAIHCQSYPFELRTPEQVNGRAINQSVATLTPTDILFVIDNSGSMLTARTELAANISSFVNQLATSNVNLHAGIITTDVECNVPDRSCPTDAPSGPNYTSLSCCGLVDVNVASGAAPTPLCTDRDLNGDGNIDWSNCDAGRLRAPQGKPAYWTPPTAQEANAWASDFSGMIMNLGCEGSGLESGLEAARRAINCSVYGWDPNRPDVCPSKAAAQLNAGFIRSNADLVIIFVTDEDDCSFLDPNVYLSLQPGDGADPNQQATHLCSPQECYAYWGANQVDSDNLQTWADPLSQNPYFVCTDRSGNTYDRQANPPYPVDVNTYLGQIVAAKGGDVTKVRAAGILSGTQTGGGDLNFTADSCFGSGLGVSNACDCWSASYVNTSTQENFYCAFTETALNHPPNALQTPYPPHAASTECSKAGSGSPDPSTGTPGCNGLAGGRYAAFLQSLSTARQGAAVQSDTLAASICQQQYDATMFDIVNTIILTSCFDLNCPTGNPNNWCSSLDPNDIQVVLNGTTLPYVPPGSKAAGWSLLSGPEICLEGGIKKNIGDQFNIFVLGSSGS